MSTVVVNVTVGENKQVPRRYEFRFIDNLSQLHEQLSREPGIGHGRFYQVRPDGTANFIPFSEYSRPYVGHPGGLYYSVYDEDTQEQHTQLDTAIRTGDLATVRGLVPSVFDADMIVPFNGSLLHQAVTHGQVPIVEYLLQQGANVNIDDGRFLPLSDAVRTRNLPMVRLLVENGAEINRDTPGYPFSSTILSNAIYSKSLPIIDYLLRSGANVEYRDHGSKPIHIAVRNNDLEAVKMLVEAGANINGKTKFHRRTPLMEAALNGYPDIVEYLLKMGADTNVHDMVNKDAKQIAREYGRPRIANLIQEYSEFLMKEPEL